ncbi:hypothetical protein [Ensifer canadensis]|uniref:hypothetical protein n=1 Tax=Ensifer canadensis TaxID=555315 RepID=UPI0035E3CF7F
MLNLVAIFAVICAVTYVVVHFPNARRGLTISIAIVVGAYFAYKFFFPTYAWNQKLTVTIGTPAGPVTASSVTRITWTAEPQLLPEIRGHSTTTTGEAAFVDLGEGKYVVALLRDADALVRRAIRYAAPGTPSRDVLPHINRKIGEVMLLPQVLYPRLVTFADISDPATVREINPGDASASLGPGYSVHSITLTVTAEPVTTGNIDELFPCLSAGVHCIPENTSLPYDHTARFIPNYFFRSQ